MNPYLLMEQKYAEHPREMTFGWYCDYFARNGYLFSTPEFFIMGRAVPKDATKALMLDLSITFPREKCNTWYVFAMAGDMAKAWSILPHELPWIAFERLRDDNLELTFVERERLKRLSTPNMQPSNLF